MTTKSGIIGIKNVNLDNKDLKSNGGRINRCKLCGHLFDETEKAEICKGSPACNCRMVRCPNCGYENLPELKKESKLMKFFKKRIKTENK